MGTCSLCGDTGITISNSINVCVSCLRRDPDRALEIAKHVHHSYRIRLGLPPEPPRDSGLKCSLCVNECLIPVGGKGFCGVWTNKNGRLEPIEGHGKGIVYWYYDSLPTNCVADPVCPARTCAGYPVYAARPGTEYGYYNLAVFFAGCSLDCVFCQNWDHKEMIASKSYRLSMTRSVDELVDAALDPKVTCVCYFGGDPAPHMPYALAASRKMLLEARRRNAIKRICWETNGLENPKVLREATKLSLASGGIVKFDWKAWTPSVYEALTGVNGYKAVRRLKENTKLVASMWDERPEIPLLVVSTLLVPGYVDEEEVRSIAEYLASINPEIPYVLLAFHPDHRLRDLPPTSTRHAYNAKREALRAGLKRVFIGNIWLLGDYY